jgi:hypothetical protein
MTIKLRAYSIVNDRERAINPLKPFKTTSTMKTAVLCSAGLGFRDGNGINITQQVFHASVTVWLWK